MRCFLLVFFLGNRRVLRSLWLSFKKNNSWTVFSSFWSLVYYVVDYLIIEISLVSKMLSHVAYWIECLLFELENYMLEEKAWQRKIGKMNRKICLWWSMTSCDWLDRSLDIYELKDSHRSWVSVFFLVISDIAAVFREFCLMELYWNGSCFVCSFWP